MSSCGHELFLSSGDTRDGRKTMVFSWEKYHWSKKIGFLVVVLVSDLPSHTKAEPLFGDVPDSMVHGVNLKTPWGCP